MALLNGRRPTNGSNRQNNPNGFGWRPDWRTFVSAVLLVASYPPWDLRYLIFIALIPWFSAIRRRATIGQAMIQGLWLGISMSVLGFYWVAYVLKQFGMLPLPVAVFGLLGFSLIGQPQFLFFAPFYLKFRGRMGRPLRALVRTLCLALLYTGMDWFIPKLFKDTLGHALYSAPWLRQAADLGGASLLTFAIFWINDALFGLYRELRYRREPSFWPALAAAFPALGSAVSLLIMLNVYGAWRSDEIAALIAHPKGSVQAGVIQANIGDFDKLAAEQGVRDAAQKVVERYLTLSDRALAMDPKPEFLVWPETAYPSTFRTPMTSEDLARDQRIESFVSSRGVPLLFGGYDRALGKDYNTLFLLSGKAGDGFASPSDFQVYHKNILLLFGEFVPGTEDSPLFQRYFPQVANFGRGPGPEVVKIPLKNPNVGNSILAGPIICYEALFSNYVVGAAAKGSQLILNITNDSWFGPYGEAELHLALSVFRSIETRLPQLRSTNTGVSALILPDGTIARRTGTFREEIMNVSIPIIDSPSTLIRRIGDWFGGFALVLGALGLATIFLYRRSRR